MKTLCCQQKRWFWTHVVHIPYTLWSIVVHIPFTLWSTHHIHCSTYHLHCGPYTIYTVVHIPYTLRIINGVTTPCDTVSFSVGNINTFTDPADHTDPHLPTRVQRRNLARVVAWWGAWGCVRVSGGRVGDRLWTRQLYFSSYVIQILSKDYTSDICCNYVNERTLVITK